MRTADNTLKIYFIWVIYIPSKSSTLNFHAPFFRSWQEFRDKRECVMAEIININHHLHQANVHRVIRRMLETFGSIATDNDIAITIHHPIPGLNNWFTLKFLINRYYPSPALCHLCDIDTVETLIIENMLKLMSPPSERGYRSVVGATPPTD